MTDLHITRRGRWAVSAMFLANGFVMGAWAPQIPLLLPRHDITEAVLGLLILVLGLGAVTAMVFAGRLIDIFGARRLLCVFALAILPALPLVVLAPNMAVLIPAMALFGATLGSMDVVMNAHAVEVERRLGRAIMSSLHGFWSVGGFVGGAGGGWLLASLGSGGQAFWAAGGAALLVVIAIPFLAPDDPRPEVIPGTAPVRARLLPREGSVWLLGVLALFCMVPEGAVLDWAALYLRQELGAEVARSGLAFAFFSGAMAVMRFAGDGVRNRFGAVATLRWSGLIASVGLMGAAVAPGEGAALVGFFIAGLGVANMMPIMFSAAGNLPGLSPGAGIAAVSMMGYSGILIAPSAIGFVAEHAGFRLTYGALAALLVVVALMAGRATAADGLRPSTA